MMKSNQSNQSNQKVLTKEEIYINSHTELDCLDIRRLNKIGLDRFLRMLEREAEDAILNLEMENLEKERLWLSSLPICSKK